LAENGVSHINLPALERKDSKGERGPILAAETAFRKKRNGFAAGA